MSNSGISLLVAEPVCRVTGKKVFMSRQLAKKSGKRFGSRHRKKYRVYHCLLCSSWHLTTRR